MIELDLSSNLMRPSGMPEGTLLLPLASIEMKLTLFKNADPPDALTFSILKPSREELFIDSIRCIMRQAPNGKPQTESLYRWNFALTTVGQDELEQKLRRLGFNPDVAKQLRPSSTPYDPEEEVGRVVGMGRIWIGVLQLPKSSAHDHTLTGRREFDLSTYVVIFTRNGEHVCILDRFGPSEESDNPNADDEIEWFHGSMGAYWWVSQKGVATTIYTANGQRQITKTYYGDAKTHLGTNTITIVERARVNATLETVGFYPAIIGHVFPQNKMQANRSSLMQRLICRISGHIQYGRFGQTLGGHDFICDRCHRRLVYNGFRLVFKRDCDRFEPMKGGVWYRNSSSLRIKICRLRKHRVFRSCDTELSPGVLETYCNTCDAFVTGLH
jgi:hypothetical protein